MKNIKQTKKNNYEQQCLRMEKLKEKVKGYKAKPSKSLTLDEMMALVNSPEHRAQRAEAEREFGELCAKTYDERFQLLLEAIDTMTSLIVSFENNGSEECAVLIDELGYYNDDIRAGLITIKEVIIDPIFTENNHYLAEVENGREN
jgi:hypothetical protein